MKTIGVVSMVYLPGSFVSSILGTNFFEFDAPDEKKNQWLVSDKLWIYFAITIPLTTVTLFIWALWHYIPQKWMERIRDIVFKTKRRVGAA